MAHFALFSKDVTLVMDTCDSRIHYYRYCKLEDRQAYLENPDKELMYNNTVLLAPYPVNDYR